MVKKAQTHVLPSFAFLCTQMKLLTLAANNQLQSEEASSNKALKRFVPIGQMGGRAGDRPPNPSVAQGRSRRQKPYVGTIPDPSNLF